MSDSSDGSLVRLGLVGCGAIATLVHLRNARRLAGVQVTAIADPAPDARARAARIVPRASQHHDVGELLEREDVDAVVVTTPPATHAHDALAVLGAGKHLYLEKPVAVDLPDAERVADAARAAQVVAAVGFNRRFHPVVSSAGRCLTSGKLGPIVRVATSFEEPLEGSALPEWKRSRETGGGAHLDLGSHHVDLVRHLLDRELVATGSDLRSIRTELDDCVLRFVAGEAAVEIACSFVRGRRDVFEVEDERGHVLVLDRNAGTLTLDGRRAIDRTLVAARARAVLRPHVDPSYRPALSAFVQRVRGAEVALPTLLDGVASLGAVLAAEARARAATS